MVEYCVYWLENGEPMHEVFSSLAAGSVITEPVPADALGLGRARQVNIEGWAADYRRRLHEDDEV